MIEVFINNLSFIFLSFILIFCALMIVRHKNTIINILFLILVFLFSSFYCLYLGLEYNALIIVSIAVGAVSILFISVIMMLRINNIEFNYEEYEYYTFFLVSLVFSFIFGFIFIYSDLLKDSFLFDYQLYQDIVQNNSNILIDSNLTPINVIGYILFSLEPFLVYLCGIILFISLMCSVYILMDPLDVVSRERSQKIYLQLSRDSHFFKIKK